MRRRRPRSVRTSSPVPRRIFRPVLSRLEDRTPLATVTWIGGGGDFNWGDPLNWRTDEVPEASDDMVINQAGIIVTTPGAESVNSLTLSGAGLDLGGSLAVNGLFTQIGRASCR